MNNFSPNMQGLTHNLDLDAMRRVGAENEAVRKIALTSTAEKTAKYIYNSILKFSSQIAMPKIQPEKPKRKIGFSVE